MLIRIQNQNPLLSACIAMWAALLVIGLWPFDFFPRNRVQWLRNGDGIHFDWHGQIYGLQSWKGTQAQGSLALDRAFTIEIWLTPDQAQSWGTILCIYDPARPENFRIDQSLSDLVVRGNFQEQNRRSEFRPIWMDNIFATGRPRFLTITSGQDGTVVYLDAVKEHSYEYTPAPGNFDGRLLIGHAVSGGSAWAGTVRALAIYNRSLTSEEVGRHYQAWIEDTAEELTKEEGIAGIYPFDEQMGDLVRNHAGPMPNLLIPTRFYVLHRKFLTDPARLQRSDLGDALINLVGFVPFGFLVSLYLSRAGSFSRTQTILWTIVLGGLTSFLIEFLQAYLPTRDSSYLDLINNILGTGLGTLLVPRLSGQVRRFYIPLF